MQYTINEAAKIVGKTRQTIYRHIASKPISVILDDNENQMIEASELIRVYGNNIKFDALNGDTTEQAAPQKLQRVTSKAQDVTASIEEAIQLTKLEGEVGKLKAQLESKEEETDYLKKLLEEEKAERKASNNLLEDHRERETKWDKQFNAMENRVSNVEKSSKIWEGRARKLNKEKKELVNRVEEQNQTVWRKLFGKKSNTSQQKAG